MAGGEFRLGTDSIYMTDDGHIPPHGTSPKSWITWLRFEGKIRGSESFQLLMRIARRKLGLGRGAPEAGPRRRGCIRGSRRPRAGPPLHPRAAAARGRSRQRGELSA